MYNFVIRYCVNQSLLAFSMSIIKSNNGGVSSDIVIFGS